MIYRLKYVFTLCLLILFHVILVAQQKAEKPIAVIAYYPGNDTAIDSYAVENLTHIIYSFCHLKGNELVVDDAADSLTILKLVSLKNRNPNLKVLLSLGGWGGCKTCSEVFNTSKGRKEFARSVRKLGKQYKTDGIDLDWEYPAIEGYPGHQFLKEDKHNFTLLIYELRKALGKKQVLSFAAGGFTRFFQESVEWELVMPKVDFVNLMTYDLFHGYSTSTGHHTALFPTAGQKESVHHAVSFLDSIGVPRNKMVVGAAFYGRVWENVNENNKGLYQPGKFKRGVTFKGLPQYLSENPGFVEYWDDEAQAPYWYNKDLQLFFTHDNRKSLALKTKYVLENRLGGIMFWHLGEDVAEGGLLHAISETLNK